MLKDDPPHPLETAEQKATRYWRNMRLVIKLNNMEQEDQQPLIPVKNDYLYQLKQFKQDIKAILIGKSSEIITKYMISIQSRKNQLLREKLKRLENQKVEMENRK
jgi:hypothetical protein